MREVRRNAQQFAGSDCELALIESEFQGALLHLADLLVKMAVARDDAALFQGQASDHNAIAHHDLPLKL